MWAGGRWHGGEPSLLPAAGACKKGVVTMSIGEQIAAAETVTVGPSGRVARNLTGSHPKSAEILLHLELEGGPPGCFAFIMIRRDREHGGMLRLSRHLRKPDGWPVLPSFFTFNLDDALQDLITVALRWLDEVELT